MITEYLMRLGGGELTLRPTTPPHILADLRDIAEAKPGGMIYIFREPTDRFEVDRSTAAYAGFVDSLDGHTISFDGPSRWLDSYTESTLSHAAGTPATWLSSLLVNGLTPGSVSGSTVTRSFEAHRYTRRQILDALASAAGWEYRIRPDLTVDTGDDLFRSTPQVLISADGAEGWYRDLFGVTGSTLAAGSLVGAQTTKLVVLGQDLTATGSATKSRTLNDPTGSAAQFVEVVNSPTDDTPAATANRLINFGGARRSLRVETTTRRIRDYVEVGDRVHIWDPANNLWEPGIIVLFQGRETSPITARCIALTWPVEAGYGVAVRSNEATPRWIDLTEWVEYETGPASWTLGELPPPSGYVNRSTPEVEDRLTLHDEIGDRLDALHAWSAWANMTLQNGWSNYGAGWAVAQYRTTGRELQIRGTIKSGSVGGGSGNRVARLPSSSRPNTHYALPAISGGDTLARVDIAENGDVNVLSGDNTFVHLPTIIMTRA